MMSNSAATATPGDVVPAPSGLANLVAAAVLFTRPLQETAQIDAVRAI